MLQKNKYFLLFCVFALLSVNSSIVWEQHCERIEKRVDSISKARFNIGATSVDGLFLFAGGMDDATDDFDDVDIYNMTSNGWSTSQLSAARQSVAATSVGHLALFGGGMNKSMDYFDVVDVFDVRDTSWTTTYLSSPRTELTASSVGNFAVFAGGRAASMSSVVDIFSLANDSWTISSLSVARSQLASASIADRYVLVGGGFLGGGGSDRVDIWDSLTNTWSTATLSVPRMSLSAASVRSKVLFVGGTQDAIGTPVGAIDIFDSESWSWSTDTMTVPRDRVSATSSSILGYAWFVGGSNSTHSFANIDMYDELRDKWSSDFSLSSPTVGIAAASYCNSVLLAGGSIVIATSITSVVSSVDEFVIDEACRAVTMITETNDDYVVVRSDISKMNSSLSTDVSSLSQHVSSLESSVELDISNITMAIASMQKQIEYLSSQLNSSASFSLFGTSTAFFLLLYCCFALL